MLVVLVRSSQNSMEIKPSKIYEASLCRCTVFEILSDLSQIFPQNYTGKQSFHFL